MGKFFYAVYAMIIIMLMGFVSFTSAQGPSNPNSAYHGSSWGSGSSGGYHK
jgi:branched-subunit amino acid permease